MHEVHECPMQSMKCRARSVSSGMDHVPLVTEQISCNSCNMDDDLKLTNSQLIATINVSSFIIKQEDHHIPQVTVVMNFQVIFQVMKRLIY